MKIFEYGLSNVKETIHCLSQLDMSSEECDGALRRVAFAALTLTGAAAVTYLIRNPSILREIPAKMGQLFHAHATQEPPPPQQEAVEPPPIEQSEAVPPPARTWEDHTLIEAVYHNDLELMKEFVASGGDLNRQLEAPFFPLLYLAVNRGSIEMFSYLLDQGANPNILTKDGTSLYLAADEDSTDHILLLIQAGAEIDHLASVNPPTALYRAIAAKKDEVFLTLLEAGARTDIDSPDGKAFEIAAAVGNLFALEELLKKGDVSRGEMSRALELACLKDHPEAARILISRGAQILPEFLPELKKLIGAEEVDHYLNMQQGAGSLAAKLRMFALKEKPKFKVGPPEPMFMFEEKAPAEGQKTVFINGPNGPTLVSLSEGMTSQDVQELRNGREHFEQKYDDLQNNGNMDKEKDEFLIELIANEQKTLIERLIQEYVPNVNHVGEKSPYESALMLALYRGKLDIAKLLIENGADPNQVSDRKLPLQAALGWKGSRPLVELLLEKGALINQSDGHGMTPLKYAIDGPDRLRFLIERGADVNQQDDQGRTPLHFAAEKFCVRSAQIFIRHGADLTIPDNNGKTPPDLAKEKSRLFGEFLEKVASETTSA